MLQDQMPQIMRPGLLYMHDNALIHTATLVRQWMANQGYAVLQNWPPYSPDLNPIEHIWARLRDKLIPYTNGHGEIVRTTGSREGDLQEALTSAWDDIEEEYIHSVFISFNHRVDAVIAANGWYTEY